MSPQASSPPASTALLPRLRHCRPASHTCRPAQPPPPSHPASRSAQRCCGHSVPHHQRQAACPGLAGQSPVPGLASSSPAPLASEHACVGRNAAAGASMRLHAAALPPGKRVGGPPRRCWCRRESMRVSCAAASAAVRQAREWPPRRCYTTARRVWAGGRRHYR